MKQPKEKYPLHYIDKYGGYTNTEIEKFMVFCLLNRAMPYALVCKGFDALETHGLTNRKALRKASKSQIAKVLASTGYRFPNTSADFLKAWSNNPIDVKKTSREEMVASIDGIGYKLASMFLRNTRGLQYAVIDTHTKKWLKEHGVVSSDYIELEKAFMEKSHELGRNLYDLDMEIWQEKRR